MPWNGSGQVVRTDGTRTGSTLWQQAKAAARKIVSLDHDIHDEDLADAIEACINRDGETAARSNIPFGGNRITGLGAGVARTDSLNLGQAQDSVFKWAGAAGGTANALTVALTPAITAYANGLRIFFVVAEDNTDAATINVNGVGAVALESQVGAALVPGELQAGAVISAIYVSTTPSFVIAGGLGRVGAVRGETRLYTSDDTWTKPDGLAFVEVEIVGAGGSASGAGAASHSSGGGGGGEYAFARIPAAALGATEDVTVGEGGESPSAGNNAGNVGGTTSFGALLTAIGGGAGGVFASSCGRGGLGGTGGATGSIGAGESYHVAGSPGESGLGLNISGEDRVSNIANGGRGGGPLGGGGGLARNSALTGDPGGLYGGGGGGTSRGTAAGGEGADGVVIVREYF